MKCLWMPPRSCASPTTDPDRPAALRSQTPPCVISHSFSPQFGVQENPRARDTECDAYISVFLVLLSQRIFVTGEPHPDVCESARVLAPCVERERPGFLLPAVVIWMLC